MKFETNIKYAALCSVCLILCGCSQESSYHNRQCAFSTDQITRAGNGLRETGGNYEQRQTGSYTPELYEALTYVQNHSTARMKKYIASGKLVVGMNQKEVIACLYATDFKDGMPVASKTYNSEYGKYETWIVGGSSAGVYACSPPRYTLDFTNYILTCMHRTKAFPSSHKHHAFARASRLP